nr:hypothetical protein [Tanacetum cinerariifolium]
MESLNFSSQERELHQLQQMQGKAKESYMASFRLLYSLLKYFIAHTRTDVQQFRVTLIQHMKSVKKSIEERTKHKQEYDSRVNERQMQEKVGKVDLSKALDVGLVVTKYSGTKSDKQVTSSSLGNYITHVVDAYIKRVNDQVPFANVQLTAQHNVLANEQHHSVQSEPIYDTHLLEKFDRNTTLDSTNMCHRGGKIDQNAKNVKFHVIYLIHHLIT